MVAFETKKQGDISFSFFNSLSTQPLPKGTYRFLNLKTDSNNNDISAYIKDVAIVLIEKFLTFKNIFFNENMRIKDEKELFTYFINNSFLDIDTLKVFLKLIKDTFTEKREIIVDYDPDHKKSLCFCVREKNYAESNINQLISSLNDKIIDMLEDEYPTAGFNIIVYSDYKKADSDF